MLKNYEKVNLTSMQEVNDTLVSVNMDKEKLTKQKEVQALEQKDFELSKLKLGIILATAFIIAGLGTDRIKRELHW